MSAQLLADIAGQAALSRSPVKPERWVYQQEEVYTPVPQELASGLGVLP